MRLNLTLAKMLRDFVKGDLSLFDYRMAMMRVRVDGLDSLESQDKNFVYEFEVRYAQLMAAAITEYTFKQLLSYAASCQLTGTDGRTELWFVSDPPTFSKPTEVNSGNYSANCELVPA